MIKTPLRPYQNEAIEKAAPYRGFALFLEQRVGKTLTALALADIWQPLHIFIVCPQAAIRVWREQIEQHLDFSDWLCNPPKISIFNFEAILAQKDQFKRIAKKWDDVLMIVDESHRIKRRGAKTSRLIRTMGSYASYRLALTGTPIAQGIHDAWAQFNFINPQIFGPFVDFSDRYLIMGGFKNKKVVGNRNLDDFNEIFHRYSYRKTLKEVRKEAGQKPPKIHRTKIKFRLDLKSWQTYKELEDEMETIVNGISVKTPLVITQAMKLQQVAGGFLLRDKKQHPDDYLVEIGLEKQCELIRLIDSGRPGKHFIICCKFTHEMNAIAQILTDMRLTVKRIAGGFPFDGKFDTDVVLLQIASGVAIDLSTADSIIFYSWDYSYIKYEQTRFRVLSYDKRQVNYFYLIAENTIDETIYEAVTRKKNFAELVCDQYRRRRRHVR